MHIKHASFYILPAAWLSAWPPAFAPSFTQPIVCYGYRITQS
jgi:hypothetical protein